MAFPRERAFFAGTLTDNQLIDSSCQHCEEKHDTCRTGTCTGDSLDRCPLAGAQCWTGDSEIRFNAIGNDQCFFNTHKQYTTQEHSLTYLKINAKNALMSKRSLSVMRHVPREEAIETIEWWADRFLVQPRNNGKYPHQKETPVWEQINLPLLRVCSHNCWNAFIYIPKHTTTNCRWEEEGKETVDLHVDSLFLLSLIDKFSYVTVSVRQRSQSEEAANAPHLNAQNWLR